MKLRKVLLFALLIPSLAVAAEPGKGTVIMISSISGWLLLSSAFLLMRELKRSRKNREGKDHS